MIQLTYYLDCKIKPNHCIQSIETYLATLTSKDKIEFNDVKEFLNDEAEFGIKVDLTNDIENLNNINYCKITRDNVTRYYFITSKQWRSENVYLFGLELDVVNTYQEDVMNKDLYKQVKINRRHKNRWKKTGTGRYLRVYDKVDEGFGNIQNYTTSVNKTTDVIYSVHKYLNTGTDGDGDNHIRNYIPGYLTYCVPKTTSTLHTIRFGGDVPFTTLFNKSTHYSYALIYGDVKANLKLAVQPSGGDKIWYYANAFLLLLEPSSKLFAVYGLTMQSSSQATVMNKATLHQYADSGCYASLFADGACSIKWLENSSNITPTYGTTINPSDFTTLITYYKGYETTVKALGEPNYNWANSEVKQVDELPCNLDLLSYKDFIDFGDGEIIIPAQTDYLDTQMTFAVSAEEASFDKPIQERDVYYESKLYGSYVTTHALAYDNFTLPVQLEYLPTWDNEITVDFLVPLNLTNNYLIKIRSLSETKLYSNTLVCQRSNTIQVCSDAALEYIRTGYNYDLKEQSLTNFKNSLGIASSVSNIGLGLAAKGSSLGAVSALQGASSLASNLSSVITSNIENELSLAKKRDEVVNSAPGVSGNSDLSYFKYYSGNNFKYTTSEPTQEVWNSIYDLFYYSGYADNLYYNEMPTIKTREYFNYLQCDIGYININNHKERIRILEAFQNGVTFEWYYNSTWLLEGTEYENWETSIS